MSQHDAEVAAGAVAAEQRAAVQTVVGEALVAAPELGRIALAWSRPDFGLRATSGFLTGFCEGFGEGVEEWVVDLNRLFRLVGIGSVVGLTEFFARPVLESEPVGLLPQSREAVESLQAVRTLAPVVRWLDAVGPAQVLAELRDLMPAAAELATILANAGARWGAEVLALADDAIAVGRKIGGLAGRVVLELIRAVVEPQALGIGAALETPVDGGATP